MSLLSLVVKHFVMETDYCVSGTDKIHADVVQYPPNYNRLRKDAARSKPLYNLMKIFQYDRTFQTIQLMRK